MMAEVGKPGSTTTGRPSQAASTIGLPGLMPTPWTRMPGLRRAVDDAEGQVARSLRGASGEDDGVEVVPGLLEGGAQGRLVVGDHAEELGLSAVVPHGGRHGGGVGVVDLARLERQAGTDQLVAGGDDGDAGPPR